MRINNQNYVEFAENAILSAKNKKNEKRETIGLPTTSQIRNILAMTSDVYNDVVNNTAETLSEKEISRIQYLRIRIIYEHGRDKKEGPVKNFIDQSKILDDLKEIGNSKENFILFARYMEALVAFHKFYGGRD